MARFQDRSGMSDSAYEGTGFDEDEEEGGRLGDRFGASGEEPTTGYRVQGGRTTNRPVYANPGEEFYADVDGFAPPGGPRGGPMRAGVYVLDKDEHGGMNSDRWTDEPGKHVGRGPKGWARDDKRLFDDVCVRLTEDPVVDPSDVVVKVDAGEVTLEGSVPDRRMKRRAEDVAWSVGGVRDVHNRLRVAHKPRP